MPDNTDKIDALEEIQDAGIASTTVDGVTTKFDLEAIARRKRELAERDALRKTRRPRISGVDLGKVW